MVDNVDEGSAVSEAGQQELQQVVWARLRRALGELDYRRAVANAVEAGWSVSDIGAQLGISAGALEGILALARQCSPVPAGFSGASPLEVCQRYSVGDLDEDVTVAQLSAWPYERRGDTGPGATDPAEASAGVGPAGGELAGGVCGAAWDEVGLAVEGGLIPMSVYARVLEVVDPAMAWAVRSA